MESQSKKESNLPKILGIIIVVVIFVAVALYLNKEKTDEGEKEITTETTETEKTTEIDETEGTGSVSEDEAPKDLQTQIDEIINYDFSKYEILGESAQKYTRTFNALDTVVQLIVYNDDPKVDVEKIFDETQELIELLESIISKTKEGSFTEQINTNGEFDYSNYEYAAIIHQLVDKSNYYEEFSGGVLDITMEPVVRLWDINNGNTEVPAQADIDATLALVNYENFTRDEATQKYVLANGSTVDFGAIAKGHIADIVKGSLMSKGINSALVNLGGNVMTIGAKPGDKNWIIGLQDPTGNTGAQLGTIEVKNQSLVTSGNYERFFIKDGVRYHHILDPNTGYPANSGLIQTTIISDHSVDCDALSTSTFILGAEKGMELINKLDGFEAIFVGEDLEYYYSEGFMDQYNLKPIENK